MPPVEAGCRLPASTVRALQVIGFPPSMTKVVGEARPEDVLGPRAKCRRDAHARLELLARGPMTCASKPMPAATREGLSLATVEADPTDVDKACCRATVATTATAASRESAGSRRLRASRFRCRPGSSPWGSSCHSRTSATARHCAVPAHRADEVDALLERSLVWPSPGSSAVVRARGLGPVLSGREGRQGRPESSIDGI